MRFDFDTQRFYPPLCRGLLGGLLMGLAGCAADEVVVNPSQIYQDYHVLYDARRDSTFVFAAFWSDSSQVLLSANASVTANAATLDFSPQTEYSYHTAFAGQVTTLLLTYREAGGASYQQPVDMRDVGPVALQIDSIATAAAHALRWQGAPVGAGEVVTFEAFAAVPPAAYQVYQGIRLTQSQPHDSTLVLPAGALDPLGRGRRAYVLSRSHHRVPPATGGAGGRLRLTYSTGVRPVVLF